MSGNPYAPPRAPVADPAPAGPIERPRVVVLAIRTLWVSFALGIPAAILELFQPDPDATFAMTLLFVAIGFLIELAITWWLLTAAWEGRAWSRIVQLALLIAGMATAALMMERWPELFVSPWYIDAIYLAQTLLDVFGIGMLFAPSANAWYRAMRELRRR